MSDKKTNMNRRVLLVGEDARFLNECKQKLEEEFSIVTALGSDQGIKLIADQGPFAIVISDLNMLSKDGIQFLSYVKKDIPYASVILLIEPKDIETGIRGVTDGNIFKFLIKPIKTYLFVKTLNDGINQYVKNCQQGKAVEKEDVPTVPLKRILIVDDDPIVRSVISSSLRNYDDFGVLTAENGKIAKILLETIKIDLVVTDLEMPVMNGLELLSYMRDHYSDTPVIVLTWFLSVEVERKVKALGYPQYFEKPLDIDGLTDTNLKKLEHRSVEQFQGIRTSSFLQLVEAEEITCTLLVKHKQRTGYLYFLKGGLIDAETGTMKGEKAAYEIIGWENSSIEIKHDCPKNNKVINKPLMMILMEACRILDEKKENSFNENRAKSEAIKDSRTLVDR